jgi:hypothetical protein
MAESHRSLFEGPMSSLFAAEQIRQNIEAEKKGETEKLKALQPADTKVVHSTFKRKDSAFEVTTENLDEQVIGAKAVASSQAHGFVPREQAVVAGTQRVDRSVETSDEAQQSVTEVVEAQSNAETKVSTVAENAVEQVKPQAEPVVEAKPAVGVVEPVVSSEQSKHVREVPASFEAVTAEADKESSPKPAGMGV